MLVIGIAGGSGSGKTTLAEELIKAMPEYSFTVLPQDAYYKDNNHISLRERKYINFDHPSAIDFELLNQHITRLKNGNPIEKPSYSFITCTRNSISQTVYSSNILIIEGILVFANEELLSQFDLKIFVQSNHEKMLEAIIKRDTAERGRNESEVRQRYKEMVEPMFNMYVEPSKNLADIVVQGLEDNLIAIDTIKKAINNNRSLHFI